MNSMTQLAEEFRARYQVTRRDANHMLHNQLNVRWARSRSLRPRRLCLALKRLVAERCTPGQFLELIDYACQGRGEGAVTFVSVLGYDGLHDDTLSPAEFLLIQATAAMVCRLHDLFDAVAGIDRQLRPAISPSCT